MTAIGHEYAWVFFVAVAGVALYAIAWAILREPDSTRALGYPKNSPEARILRGEL